MAIIAELGHFKEMIIIIMLIELASLQNNKWEAKMAESENKIEK